MDTKNWITMSLIFLIILAISFGNASYAVYGQSRKATLVVVGDSKKKVLLCPKVESVDSNESALDILKNEFGDSIHSASFGGQQYVTGIDNLNEEDYGSTSSWMSEINGKAMDVGAAEYMVQNGDAVVFRYSLDLGKDIQYKTVQGRVQGFGGCKSTVASVSGSLPVVTESKSVQLPTPDEALYKATQFILPSGIQTDWEAISLSRATDVISNDQKKGYLMELKNRVQASHIQNAILARTILAVNALGGDSTNIAGQNLIARLYSDRSINDINSYSYALLALDSKDYKIPDHALWKRGNLISSILEEQTPIGNWSDDLSTNAVALMALASHRDIPQVEIAVQKAINYLQSIQLQSGGFETGGIENSISSSVIIASLSMLGIDPAGDAFTKSNTILQSLLFYQLPNGGFKWRNTDNENDSLAFDQAFLSLVQYKYFHEGKGSIFHWADSPVKNIKFENSGAGQLTQKMPEQSQIDLETKNQKILGLTVIDKTLLSIPVGFLVIAAAVLFFRKKIKGG